MRELLKLLIPNWVIFKSASYTKHLQRIQCKYNPNKYTSFVLGQWETIYQKFSEPQRQQNTAS